MDKPNLLGIVAIVGLIVAVIVMAVKPNSAVNENMAVSGNAELSVSPDQAEVYINVVSEALTAGEAQTANKEISNKVIAALKNLGIDEKNIETSNYYLSKKQEWEYKEQKYTEKGYILTHTLKVTTTDVQNVGKFVDAAVGAGANGIDRINFGLTKATEKDVRAQALVKATQAAKEKAQSLAETAGVKLGKVTGISESNFYYTPYVYNVRNNYDAGAGIAMDEAESISPQKVDVTSSVQITYAIN